MILLDTDICIEILRKNTAVIERRAQYNDSTGVSFMSVAELYYGAEKLQNPVKNHHLLEEFLLTIEIILLCLILIYLLQRLRIEKPIDL